MNNTDIPQNVKGYEKMIQRLTRYYKFFRYRFLLLDMLETTDTEKLKSVIFIEGKEDDSEFLRKFLDAYKNNIWGATVSIYSQQMVGDGEKEELRRYIQTVNRAVYGRNNENCSYISQVYMGILDVDKELETQEDRSYVSLKK